MCLNEHNMRHIMIICVCLQITFIPNCKLSAQISQVGFDFGYGLTKMHDDLPIILPGDDDLLNFSLIGINYSYTPKDFSFNIQTGLLYSNRGNNYTEFNYLRIPLGIEYKIGNKVQFIIGGGLFISYLLSYGGAEAYRSIDENINKFQFGYFGNIGIGFQISPKYILCLNYQAISDITKMFEYTVSTMGGGDSITKYMRGSDRFIKLSLNYRFSNN